MGLAEILEPDSIPFNYSGSYEYTCLSLLLTEVMYCSFYLR